MRQWYNSFEYKLLKLQTYDEKENIIEHGIFIACEHSRCKHNDGGKCHKCNPR